MNCHVCGVEGTKTTRCSDCNRAYMRDYYRRNKERFTAASTAWRKANPERHREYKRRWRNRNWERHTAGVQAREKRLGRASRATIAFRRILRLDPCAFCGVRGKADVDHIDPVSAGGDNHWSNLTAACPSCNRSKHNRSLLLFLLEGRVT